jgi:fructosamine-3-kinase/nicotinic acid mononucleotide adenylyltransferase
MGQLSKVIQYFDCFSSLYIIIILIISSIQDLFHLLKTSSSLRAQIFPSSNPIQLDNDEDEFTIKSISSGYVNHAFTFKVNEKFINKESPNEFFIKINRNKHAKQMFDAEVMGLHALGEACKDLIRIPQSFATGYLSDSNPDQGAWFLSEFVTMSNTASKRSDRQHRQFAERLAKMHQISATNHSQSSHSGQFGFDRNNFSIHTEQDNTWQNDWCTFFIEQRLKPVVQRMKTDPQLVHDHGKNMEFILLCERLIPHIPSFLPSNQVQFRPCLLHGDLSSQNWSVDKKGCVVLFDGSPFYGPYEMDLYTMPNVFIQAYFDAIGGPMEGYEMRFELYNLLRLLRSIIDTNLDKWRPLAFQSFKKLLIHCGAWTSSLVRFPCGVKTPVDKIKLPSSKDNTQQQKKNVILVYGGSFCPIHLNHLEVMNYVAETLEKPPYNFEILGGYFTLSTENWLKRKLPGNYLPQVYRESLVMLAIEGTRWMLDRNSSHPNTISTNIIQAIRNVYGEDFEMTFVHICGLDAVENNDKRVSIEYPLVVVDRLGYNSEIRWNEYLQRTTVENKERLIWISPWKGQMRSSTMIRHLLTKSIDANLRQNLQNFLPLSCIEYMFEYELKNWFKSSDSSIS